jgi:hypothetical protein
MKQVNNLNNGTSFDTGMFNRQIYFALTANEENQIQCVKKTLDYSDEDWADFKAGIKSISFDELINVLETLNKNGFKVNDEAFCQQNTTSPLLQGSFYDSLKKDFEDIESLKAQFELLQEKVKSEHGFLKTVFNIFSNEKPIEKLMDDVSAFEKYCRENNITFNEANQQLEIYSPPPTIFSKLKDFRFLVAAVGGGLLGLGGHLSGVDLTSHVPPVNELPGMFFSALPYFALPFVSLSIFRAFSKKSITEEAGTFGRFAGIMGLGVMIGIGVTSAMSGFLPSFEGLGEAYNLTGSDQPFSPSQYILHGIALFAGFAAVYKKAKDLDKEDLSSEKSGLKGLFNKASSVFINDKTASAIKKAGRFTEKTGDVVDKSFHSFMNVIGVPAIFVMMSSLINKGGFNELANYGSYYLTVTASMAACALALGGAAFAYGCRKKEFTEIAKTASTAFSISSSAATMPVTKESLKKMGVSEETRNAVVPLGANFNMMGTSLYLGVTAASAAVMFGMEPTLLQMATIMGMSVATAFGAPGAPASTILFLDPVLQKAGFSPEQAAKVYEMVIPADRLFDMAQTSLNVTGDMMVSLDAERTKNKKEAKKSQKNDSPKP